MTIMTYKYLRENIKLPFGCKLEIEYTECDENCT